MDFSLMVEGGTDTHSWLIQVNSSQFPSLHPIKFYLNLLFAVPWIWSNINPRIFFLFSLLLGHYYTWWVVCYTILSIFFWTSGRTYRFRVSNVGLTTSINFRIQGHNLKLIEVEGSHTLQNIYTSFDIHLGQSCSFLVTADQVPQDYYVVVSSRFTRRVLTTTAVLHYSNSKKGVSGPVPIAPTIQVAPSVLQARSIRYLIFYYILFRG